MRDPPRHDAAQECRPVCLFGADHRFLLCPLPVLAGGITMLLTERNFDIASSPDGAAIRSFPHLYCFRSLREVTKNLIRGLGIGQPQHPTTGKPSRLSREAYAMFANRPGASRWATTIYTAACRQHPRYFSRPTYDAVPTGEKSSLRSQRGGRLGDLLPHSRGSGRSGSSSCHRGGGTGVQLAKASDRAMPRHLLRVAHSTTASRRCRCSATSAGWYYAFPKMNRPHVQFRRLPRPFNWVTFVGATWLYFPPALPWRRPACRAAHRLSGRLCRLERDFVLRVLHLGHRRSDLPLWRLGSLRQEAHRRRQSVGRGCHHAGMAADFRRRHTTSGEKLPRIK